MIIPISSLPAETLHNIISNYVLQEGTEYGLTDVSLEDKIKQVHQQLINESAVLVYSELYETVNILPAEQFKGA